MFNHDHDHARQRAVGTGRRTPAHGPSSSPALAQLIFLQAAAGNRAVAEMIAAREDASAGNRAVGLFVARSNGGLPPPPRTGADVLRDLRKVGAEINTVREAARDLVRPGLGREPRSTEELLDELGRIAAREGEDSAAAELGEELRGLIERRDGLLAEDRALRGVGGPTEFSTPPEKTEASPKSTSAAPPKKAEGSAAPKAMAKAEEPAAKAAAEAGVTAAKKEGAVTKAILKAGAKTGARIAVGLGRVALALLMPGPEDAIVMMGQFAGSYQEAWEAIEQRYARDGIAFGIATGMMGLEWPWVTANLWRRFPTAGLEEQILGAVGKAEKSFNDGLRRGHSYGAGHPRQMKSEYLGQAFAILADAGYNTDEEGLFTIETVSRMAGVLMPVADDFLRQAAERKAAREQKAAKENAREARAGNRV
jgi:hypothetical protein